ncbi:hypothetical protein, partial [Pseudonocardia sp. Ae707_Ps2]|uniref:hypothetical protein n=1 Tax=Pseudonocardia sp. Ae707_Ps2 TaxID=2212992 RepID=UPI00307D3972
MTHEQGRDVGDADRVGTQDGVEVVEQVPRLLRLGLRSGAPGAGQALPTALDGVEGAFDERGDLVPGGGVLVDGQEVDLH